MAAKTSAPRERCASSLQSSALLAFDSAITQSDATRHMCRPSRQPARASLRSALVCAGAARAPTKAERSEA
jgi:hypothetical protein